MTTNIIVAPDSAIYENTPVLSKVECAVIQQGVAAAIQWQLRDRDGYPVDLSGLFITDAGTAPFDVNRHKNTCSDSIWEILHSLNPDYYAGGDPKPLPEIFLIEVRIQPADEPQRPMWIVPAKVADPKFGVVQFKVPDQVSDLGGIFVLNIGICRGSDHRPLYVHRGLLSVERSAWRGHNVDCKMPTISDIRMRILDTDTENLLQGYVEFTTADILDSVVSAVREWNGASPHLAAYVFTCHTFPWIEPWLNKIIANLYQKAVLRYTRNKLQVAHGGVQGDDLARDKEYQAIAMQYDQRWREWLLVKKRELNLAQFNGLVSSPYAQCVNSVSRLR